MRIPLPDVNWVYSNWTWAKVKPVLRCALSAWLSLVMFAIPTVQRFMGQASFLVLIASFLSPPSDPFMAVLEREIIILLFSSVAWAWSSLGIFLAHLARQQRIGPNTVNLLDIYGGKYVEAAPSIVLAVFLIVGSCFFSFIKARQGPGPYTFACVFGGICSVISLTTAALFPFPFYTIGQAILLPLCIHSAIAIIASTVVFPSSVSAQFTTRLGDVVSGLRRNLDKQKALLRMVRDGEDWYQQSDGGEKENGSHGEASSSDTPAREPGESEVDGPPKEKNARIQVPSSSSSSCSSRSSVKAEPSFTKALSELRSTVKSTEGLLTPLAASSRLMKSDLVYGRICPSDFKDIQATARRLAVRSDGMAVYWGLVERERDGMGFATPAMSKYGSRIATPASSRPASIMQPSSPERGRTRENISQLPDAALGGSRATTRDNSPVSPSTPITPEIEEPREQREEERRRSNLHHVSPRNHRDSAHRTSHHHHHSHSHHAHAHHSLLQASLHHLTHSIPHSISSLHVHIPYPHRKEQPSVGVFESTRYVFLETTHLPRPQSHEFTKNAAKILSESCQSLVDECDKSLGIAEVWVRAGGREGRWHTLLGQLGLESLKGKERRIERRRMDLEGLEEARRALGDMLERFRSVDRHRVLDPYRPILDTDRPQDLVEGEDVPPHRYLFHCYVYQYHLMRFSQLVCDFLDDAIRIEKERKDNQLWTPMERMFRWNIWQAPEDIEKDDDENPELVQGMQPSWVDDLDLGLARRRNPDFLPPKNAFEWVMDLCYRAFSGFAGGNILYAIKAGILTVIMCVPVFLRHSAGFAYENKFVWAIIMAQLTLARFRGDTVFGITARVMSTFLGGVVGMIMWYISCGSGRGNAYGLAAVGLVCFPFFFYARLYWPGPPMTNIIFFVTSVLVVGYSYQDIFQPLQSSPGVGFDVAWRRFVLVTAGVTAAGLFSFLPPSTTIRLYQRTTLATTSSEIGAIYCSIVSFANTRREPDIQEIVGSLTAIRSKLIRSVVLRTNVVYEFSLRGRWPAKRYHDILDLQIKIAYALSHLMSTIEKLEPAWTKAFLRRTRFLDPDFQGDVLAVISMISTALRTGCPLPQITPCPLLDRFMAKYHGLNVIHKESEDDYGLPRTVTRETLENEQYMIFCVGISTAFGIITNLDKLMVATKEIVGEQYHIHGLGASVRFMSGNTDTLRSRLNVPNGVEMGSRTSSVV